MIEDDVLDQQQNETGPSSQEGSPRRKNRSVTNIEAEHV